MIPDPLLYLLGVLVPVALFALAVAVLLDDTDPPRPA